MNIVPPLSILIGVYLLVGLFVAIQAYSADYKIGASGFLMAMFLWVIFLGNNKQRFK